MAMSGKARRYVIASLIVVLGAASIWVIFQSVGLWSTLRWNTWVNDVRIVCQPGSNESTVRLFLGEPSSIRSATDPMLGLVPSPPDSVPGAERILVYSRSFTHGGYWAAHIYIGKNGAVIAYHIGAS